MVGYASSPPKQELIEVTDLKDVAGIKETPDVARIGPYRALVLRFHAMSDQNPDFKGRMSPE
jgi:hypothetical protein